jgi:hypothetical protein
MAEFDRQLNFNTFDILLVVISINILLFGNSNYIIDCIYYIINLDMIKMVIIMAHILAAYFVMSDLQFEIKYRASIKFNSEYIF